MDEPTTAWEFAETRFPKLKITSAETSLSNGGNYFNTKFYTSNKKGLGTLQFSSNYGLSHPLDVDRVTVTLHGGKGLCIDIRGICCLNNTGVDGWPEHRQMLVDHFGPNFVQAATVSTLLADREQLVRRINEIDRFVDYSLRGVS